MVTVDVYQVNQESLVQDNSQVLVAVLAARPCRAVDQAAIEKNLYQVVYRVAAESLEDAAATIRGHGRGYLIGSPGAGNDRVTGRSDLYIADAGEMAVFNDPDFDPYHGIRPAGIRERSGLASPSRSSTL
jgi:hypothetical protein